MARQYLRRMINGTPVEYINIFNQDVKSRFQVGNVVGSF
jgi:hypothetical protein